jgi:Holliday junction resolvasome RuvABC endonuclease subunit
MQTVLYRFVVRSTIPNHGSISTQIRHFSSKLEPPKLYFLGLDVASKSTGYTILDTNTLPIEAGLIDTSKTTSMYEYGKIMKDHFNTILMKYPNSTWIVGIEEFIQRHRLSNATTLFKLCSCNTLASYEITNIFKTEPLRVNVAKARSFLKLKKEDTITSKEQVYHELKHLLPASFTPILGSRNNKLMKCNYDITDSLLIALYTSMLYKIRQRVNNDQELASFVSRYVSVRKLNSLKKKFKSLTSNEISSQKETQKELTLWFEEHLLEQEFDQLLQLKS